MRCDRCARCGSRPVVKAVIVLREPQQAGAALTEALQSFVKSRIAPYKYPRVVEYVRELPRTQTGKLQRFGCGRTKSKDPQ